VNDQPHDCPLCGLDFTGEACHSGCPMARACTLIRCPRCGYEFLEEGSITKWFRRLTRRTEARP